MSRATISTGSIPLRQGPSSTTADSQRCHVLILADFSGRAHRGLNDATHLASRKIIEVDRDNLEEVFTQLNVTLQLPLADAPIRFREFDDLHPDFIHERVPLFDQLRALKRRLNNPATFAAAAAEISGPGGAEKTAAATGGTTQSASDDLLDSLLQSPTAQAASGGDVQALIRQIAAPYVIPRPDPRLDELQNAVDESSAQLLRKILHSSAFQSLEASWRGLQLLTRRLETDGNLKLFIADISLDEIVADAEQDADDANAENTPVSQLHKLLVEQRAGTGATPFGLILGDYRFEDQPQQVSALALLGDIAQQLGSSFIAGGSERLAGCTALHVQPDPDDWTLTPDTEFTDCWQTLREDEVSQHIALVAPRFLLRLPYGKRTSPISAFAFEELPAQDAHDFYLWGNGGWLVTLLLADAWSRNGKPTSSPAADIGDLPLHVRQQAGESQVTPCAEILMTDTTASALQQAGLTVIRSVQNQDVVRVTSHFSLSDTGTLLRGRWTLA
ncbi:MAG TPA: type VI secretion system contractile sheath large subunit [Candidatus Kapabacteria bacterium]|nr:type VI secretion system contractile sheath large subunit [Candidatus Kapabacteria bacterium]